MTFELHTTQILGKRFLQGSSKVVNNKYTGVEPGNEAAVQVYIHVHVLHVHVYSVKVFTYMYTYMEK